MCSTSALPGLILAIIALSALSPLVVPLIGGVLGLVSKMLFPRSQIRELVSANLRDGVRRSASTTAPIVMLVGLVVGFSGVINVVSAGAQHEAIDLLDGDLIVTATEPIGDRLAALDGVLNVSEEVPLRVRVDSVGTPSRFEVNAIAIDPITYRQTHRLGPVVGNLDGLQGQTIAIDEDFASGLHVKVGDTVEVRIDGIETEMQVVAVVPYTLSGAPVLLPIAFAPNDGADRRYIVQTTSEASLGLPEQITDAIGGSSLDPLPVSVSALPDWVQADLDNQQQANQNAVLAVLGLVTLYVFIAMINAVVIAASNRPAEFASARLTGLTRKQVVQMAAWESITVVTAGVILGAIAAGATIASTTVAVSDIVGTRITDPPWALLGAVTAGAALIVGIASVWTTLSATRQSPISIAGARE
jgi:putative ABC transport system permease protein